MSATHTPDSVAPDPETRIAPEPPATEAPATEAPATEPPAPKAANRTRLQRWIVGGGAGAAILTAVVIAVWPASAADKARDDGERLGEAVGQLYDAQSAAEIDAALAEIDAAVSQTRVHAGDHVAEQVADQQDALARAADGFVGAHTTDDAFEADLYQAELDAALDDLTSQASDFRAEGPEVNQAFWEGVQKGLPID
jgi:hypothetical protein